MKKRITKISAAILTCVMMLGMAACGDDKASQSTEPQDETTLPPTVISETTTASTLTTYSAAPDESNTTPVSWTETELEAPAVMYCYNVDQFLNVRTGPGTSYEVAGHLEPGMSVTVTARTSDGWYRTSDGYYVNEAYLTSTAQ